MAQPASPCLVSAKKSPYLQLFQLGALFAAAAANAQTPQQQYVYGAVPVTATTSEIAAYAKNGQDGALALASGSPIADAFVGSAMAVDALGRFLFVSNASTSNISMFQINSATGALTEVPGSPFSTGPTENPNMAPTAPVCVATEKSGQFLYVGYRFGNFSGLGAVNEYVIDAANRQLVSLPGQPSMDIPSSPVGLLSDPRGLHLYVGLGRNLSTGAQDAGITVYSIDPVTGTLGSVGSAGNAQVDGQGLAIDPSGRFFFDSWGSNVGGIDSALISPADGTATSGITTVSLGAGEIPGAMLVDSSGKFLYVQQGATPVVYSINQTTGSLSVAPSALSVLTFKLNSAAADPLGPYLYSLQLDGIHAFLIDSQSGALSEIPGSPFNAAAGAVGVLAISGTPVQAVSGPSAALFPASENFSSVTVGQTSSSHLVTLTNTGDQSLAVNSLAVAGTNAGDFPATPTCAVPTVLSPNSSCTISIIFSPAGAGSRQASLTVGDNAPGSPQSVPLVGNGVSPLAGVSLTPGSLTFAMTAQGSTSPTQTVTVTSVGPATLHISSVLLSGSNSSDFQLTSNTCSGPFSPNTSCIISVAFSPLGAGQRLASIAVADDAPNSPQSVQLTGTGEPGPPGKPAVTLSPKAVALGTLTQGTSAGPRSVTLTNSGTAPLHIASVSVSGVNSSAVSMANTCTGAAYAVGGTCTIGVSIAPLSVGLQFATITIADDAPDSPQTIAISADANPAFTITPAAADGTSVTVKAGQTASFMLQISPGAGFTGTVSFSCTGAPTAASCHAPSVALNSGVSVSYVVTVSTTAANAGAIPWTRPLHLRPLPFSYLPPILWLIALCGYLFDIARNLKRRRGGFAQTALIAAPTAVVLLTFVAIAGCGGGSVAAPQSATTPQPSITPTPQGTFTIMLTPASTTAGGTPLAPMSPIPLTLIVQ